MPKNVEPDAYGLLTELHESELVRFCMEIDCVWAWPGGFNTNVILLDMSGNVIGSRATGDELFDVRDHGERLGTMRQIMIQWQAELLGCTVEEILRTEGR